MKLNITKIADIFNGLHGIDGLQEAPAVAGNPAIFKPFKFSSKFTTLKVKLIHLLREKVDHYNEVVKDIERQHKVEPGDDPDVVAEKNAERDKKVEQLDKEEHDLPGLRKFKIADLNIYDPDTNKKGNVIASSIIERCWPLIEDTSALDPDDSKDEPAEREAPEAEPA